MTAPDRTTWTNSLASALPAGISYDAGPGERLWRARRIAEFQADRLAESGYVLLHPEYVGEATVERLVGASNMRLPADIRAKITLTRHDIRAVLAVLAALAAAPGPTDDEAVTP